MQKPLMTDFHRLLARQKFKDEKEMKAFLDNLTGKSLYDLPEMELSPQEKAQDLVYEAFQLTPAKAKKNIEKALALDANCIEAYEFLASRQKTPEKIIEMLDQGIAIGREMFGGKFLKKNKGKFWGIHETRPFMRCLFQKADIFVVIGKIAEGVEIMEEMLKLNDGDNQGVRFSLLSALIVLNEPDKFRKYNKMVADDNVSASVFYSRALFAYKTEGDSANARKLLEKAFEKNPNVVQKLLDILDENYKFKNVEHYSLGSPEEAIVYWNYAIFTWKRIEGAIEWLLRTIRQIL